MNTTWNMREKTILVTGGTKGIGYEIARGLAINGATVLIVGRDGDRGEAAVSTIQQQTGNPKVSFIQADLSSLAEARHLADHITTHYPQLHVLVNNAGGSNTQHKVTADGLEATFATNHLAPFLLTNQLLPLLKASAPARIININSLQHRSAHIDFDDLQSEKNYDRMQVYQQAKLANLYAIYELARRLEGTSVTINAADPLGTLSGARAMSASLPLAVRLILPLISLFPQLFSPRRAAQSAIHLASSPDVEGLNGKYVNFRKQVIRSSPASYDKAIAEKVWHISEVLTGQDETQP